MLSGVRYLKSLITSLKGDNVMDLYNLVVSAKLSKGGSGDEPVLIDKTITANGTYNASSDSADGYKEVVVNVPSVTPTGNINITSTAQTDVSAYATAQVVDADLVASNIKKDVDILGVVGTYEGGGGGGGIEIETGTHVFTENTQREFISFANTHSDVPAIVILAGLQDSADYWSNNYVTRFEYVDYFKLFGKGINVNENKFGYSVTSVWRWYSNNIQEYRNASSHKSSEPEDTDASYPRYFVRENGFYAIANPVSSAAYWFPNHSALEWHWIAIWV